MAAFHAIVPRLKSERTGSWVRMPVVIIFSIDAILREALCLVTFQKCEICMVSRADPRMTYRVMYPIGHFLWVDEKQP